MVAYNLSHLSQKEDQDLLGPIQDDEALFLYSLIRVTQIRRVLEIGGFQGYSAANFCAAVGEHGIVFSVDLNQVPLVAANHVTIQKDAGLVSATDVGGKPLDLVFFDCHDYSAQLNLFHRLRREFIITDDTLLSFHDTNLHPKQIVGWAYPVEDGWVHQNVERRMVNELKQLGYDALVLGTSMAAHGPHLPFRHGLTIMKKFRPLAI